jgi:hypothetical protein
MSAAVIQPARRAWINYAAATWSVLFAAPHIWWAMGIPAGFPGGERSVANHHLLYTTWRFWFDLLVILLSGVGIFVALALARPGKSRVPRSISRTLAWLACGLLGLRGFGGMIIDGFSGPPWAQIFAIGSVLFGGVAWTSRRAAR